MGTSVKSAPGPEAAPQTDAQRPQQAALPELMTSTPDGGAIAARLLAGGGQQGLPALKRLGRTQQHQTLLGLQRTIGNAAVSRRLGAVSLGSPAPAPSGALLRACACGAVPESDGEPLRRQPGDPAADPVGKPTGTPTSEPSWPESTLADFCRAFPDLAQARQVRDQLRQNFVGLERSMFGDEVAAIWDSYLSRKKGDSLSPRVFKDAASKLVQGFANSTVTRRHQTLLVDLLKSALPTKYPTSPPPLIAAIPVSSLLTQADLEEPINFNVISEIPGNIAGGVGSSDAGPDLRRVSGEVSVFRSTDDAGRTTAMWMVVSLRFFVRDAADFCPGDSGAPTEQGMTTLLSRLEASDLAYDVPFEVTYTTPAQTVDFAPDLIKRWYPDAVTGPAPPAPPPTPPPAPPDERPER